MPPHNQLSFVRAVRGGGGCRTKVVYWDYLVDGVSLRERLRIGDFIPPLGWLRPEADVHFRQMLLLKEPGDLKPERTPLFVCPECADYGCGVITAAVTKEGDFIIWDSFAFENDYSEDIHPVAGQRRHRLVFHRSEYWSAIHSLPFPAASEDTVEPA